MIPAPTAALIASAGFLVLVAFQAALALGAPLGRAAWGGKFERLPPRLRVASAVSMVVWLVAVVIVLARAGTPIIALPEPVAFWGTWAIVVVLALGVVANLASSSPYERFGWAPIAFVVGLFTLIVAWS